MAAPPQPVPTPAALEADRDRARTERLLEQLAAYDLDAHRARQDAGRNSTVTSHVARGAW